MNNNFVEELYELYRGNTKDYFLHLENVEEHELISFAAGILYILKVLKIEPKDIKCYDHNMLDELNYIIKEKFQSSRISLSDEERLHDFIYDKDDVGFREYVSSGERNSI